MLKFQKFYLISIHGALLMNSGNPNEKLFFTPVMKSVNKRLVD